MQFSFGSGDPRSFDLHLPQPVEIARRAARDPRGPQVGELWRHNCEFGLADTRDAGHAVIKVGEASLRVGHYVPTLKNWKLYPEFVEPLERRGVESAFEKISVQQHRSLLAEALDLDTRHPMVDLRDPLTVRARLAMSRLLTASRLGPALLQRQPLGTRGIQRLGWDEATSARLTLSQDLSGPRVENEPFLNVVYKGVLVENARGMRTRENSTTIRIAERSIDDPDTWIPDLALVTPREWAIVRTASDELARFKRDPRFSTDFCAVTYGFGH